MLWISVTFLLFIACQCTISSSSEDIIAGYVVQKTWYSTSVCQGTPSFVLTFQINKCYQYSSSQFVFYEFDYNVSTIPSTFVVNQKLFLDVNCTISSGKKSAAQYNSSCSVKGANAIKSSFYPTIPTTVDVGSQTSFYDNNLCLGDPTTIYWTEQDACSTIGKSSYATSCTNSEYTYKSWAKNATCSGTPTSLQDVSIISSCQPYESSTYTLESCSGTAASPKSKGSCFAASETVQERDRGRMAISEVRVGHRVLTASSDGTIKYSKVTAVPHSNRVVLPGAYVNIRTAGRQLLVTPDHLLLGHCRTPEDSARLTHLSNESCHVNYLIAAKDLTPLSCSLSTIEGDEQVWAVDAIADSAVTAHTVVTEDEFIIVNGVIASPFAVNHVIATAFYRTVDLLRPATSLLIDDSRVQSAVEHFYDIIHAFTTFSISLTF